jgi:hypothetical protein
MDGIRELLSAAREADWLAEGFRGLMHIAIGRKVTRLDGTVLSSGVTWRELAAELKHLHFDVDLVRELGSDPKILAARDRERFWYSAIAVAKVDSPEAVVAADRLVPKLKSLGFLVGPPPSSVPTAKPKTEARPKQIDAKKGKKKK